MIFRPAVLFVAIASLAAPVLADDASDLLRLHNEHRAANHLPALTLDTRLSAVAQDQANYQAKIGQVTHANPAGDPATRIRKYYTGPMSGWAENAAGGQRTPAAVMAAWKASPGHNANILGSYQLVGFGRSGNFWCADFVRPANVQPSTPTRLPLLRWLFGRGR